MNNTMTDFFAQLIEKSGFSEALVCRALVFSKQINIKEFSRLFFDTEPCSVENTGVLRFDEAFYPYEFYDKLKNLPIAVETSALYIYISLLETSFSDFSSRINEDDIFFDTAKKISESAREYLDAKGQDGVFDYHFPANHVRGNILRLGSFEYQHGEYDGKKAIILHVPDGADLSKEKRVLSYSLARKYFGNLPIVADSWLLYHEHKKMLSEDSNIVDFINDFDIVSTSETTDYSELFHVFGRLESYSYENLPKETSLQKAYAERIRTNLPVGSAIGILKH